MNENHLQKELDKNRFSTVKYGLFMIVFILGIMIVLLFGLKIEDQSILYMVYEYYFG